MTELATVTLEEVGRVPVAHVSGEVDASNASAIQARVLDGIRNEAPGLVIDLTATGYVDSAGIRALFEIGNRLQVRGLHLRIVAPPDSFIADVLETVRIDEKYAVDADAASAVAAIAELLPHERSRE